MNMLNNKPNKCRVCLMDNPSQLLNWTAPIEAITYEAITYLECFQKCTRLEAYADDHLPQSLCFQCAAQLQDAYEFVQKATQSHQMMKQRVYEESLEFEWVPLQKIDDADVRNTADTDINPSSSPKLIAMDEEIVIKTKANNFNSFDSEPVYDFDCNPKSTLNNNSDSSYVPEKEIKIKLKDEVTKVTDCKPTTKRKRGKQSTSGVDRIEKAREQEEQSQEDVACEFCNKPFPRKKIKRHIKRVHNMRMLLCHACPRTFKDARHLTQHSLTHDNNRQREFTCDQCGRNFFTRSAFLIHGKIHETNRQAEYQCEICDKQFFHKGSLKIHMLIHTGETLECKICEKRYPRKIDLRIHMRSHSGDMPYKCRYCERAFTRVGVLNKHERRHEGLRYKCDICEKEYLNHYCLIKHREVHTGMPLKCLICGKGFVPKSKMKRHIGGVHKIKNLDEMEKFILKVETKKEYRERICVDN